MKRRQHGAAILLAIAVVALAALAATALLLSQSTWARRVELATGRAQSQRIAEAGLEWSRALLYDDRRASQIDHAGEPWALQMPPVPVEGGRLLGRIDDQQARFNLNNLLRDGVVDQEQLACLRRLLAELDLPPALAGTLADWIDADGRGDSEDAYYLGLASPYLAGNRPLTDLAELALVRGFDAPVRARLQPFVTALPRTTAVNVNTAPAEVIAAIVPGLGLDAARGLVAARQRGLFLDRTAFLARLPAGVGIPAESIAVGSDYFLVQITVELEGTQARSSALLARDNAQWPTVVWRQTP
jgi:general secretion pathway protein K